MQSKDKSIGRGGAIFEPDLRKKISSSNILVVIVGVSVIGLGFFLSANFGINTQLLFSIPIPQRTIFYHANIAGIFIGIALMGSGLIYNFYISKTKIEVYNDYVAGVGNMAKNFSADNLHHIVQHNSFNLQYSQITSVDVSKKYGLHIGASGRVYGIFTLKADSIAKYINTRIRK